MPQLPKDDDDHVAAKPATDRKKVNWKKIAPKSGEPETITRSNRTFYWCAKCGRGGLWSGTHKTSEHTRDKSRNGTTGQTNTPSSTPTPSANAASSENFGISLLQTHCM